MKINQVVAEDANPKRQAAKAIAMKKAGIKPKTKGVTETTGVTDYNPKSQGGTRKELLAKYHKTKNPKDAEAARKAGATQKELQGVAEGFDPEYDDEAGMFKNDLQTIQRVSTHLEKEILDNENLPEW